MELGWKSEAVFVGAALYLLVPISYGDFPNVLSGAGAV